MKNILFISFFLYSLPLWATNYYVDPAGSDGNAGTSTGSPWATIAKVNGSTFAAGDSILFKRGGSWIGNLIPPSSGTSVARIVFGSYGSGANPIITGLFTVPAWTNLGSNIWESTSAVSTLQAASVVLIAGNSVAMGRTPNTGYLTYQTFSTNTSITSSSLTGSPDWTGAEVVIKKQRWIEDRDSITSGNSSTLTYTHGTGLPYVNDQSYNGQNGWGFFIQNSLLTLDQQNEWYYNPSSKKLDEYSTATPATTQVSTVDTLVYIVGKKYLTFDHMAFSGANYDIFYLGADSNITIQNCQLSYAYNGILGQNFSSHPIGFQFLNSTIKHCNNDAASLSSEFTGASFLNDTVQNSGMFPGMGGSGDGQYEGINVQGIGSKVKFCEVDTTGYIPIGFKGTGISVDSNFINQFCIVKDDGGGIYTQPTTDNTDSILSNIITNGIGCNDGTNGTGLSSAYGIYNDNTSSGVVIENNSVGGMSFGGIYLHDSHSSTIRNNLVYNCQKTSLLIKNDDTPDTIRNIIVKGNVFVEKDSTQVNSPQNLCVNFTTLHNDISSFGTVDSNYYARPIDDNLLFDEQPAGTTHNLFNRSGWASLTGYDTHSHSSPKTITTTADLSFQYNNTGSSKIIPLSFNYMDAKSVTYNGTITLAPYCSALLIKNGAIIFSGNLILNANVNFHN